MRSSNPVLTRLDDVARPQRRGPDYDLGGYAVQKPYGPVRQVGGELMTLDHVVVRTVMLLAVTGITAALGWLLLPTSAAAFGLMVGASLAGLVLGLVISVARITNPIPIFAYAILEGALLGLVSRIFEHFYPGIVLQAVIGTFGVFALMAVLYRFRVLRATPRFARFVIGALSGVVLLGLANLAVFLLFKVNLGLVEYSATGKVGWLPIVFSLVVIGVGALTFILDFEMIAQGARAGLPERFAWYCAFGLLAGLIFVYWEILRLLSYLRR